MQFQRIGALAEIGLRRRLDTKSLPPQRDLVHVKREDLLLGQRIFDAIGEDRLLDLARIAIFLGQQQVFRHLLGDRRCAPRPTGAGQIVVDGN